MTITATPPAARLAYSVEETAATIGTCRTWVDMRIKDGSLRSVKRAGRRFVTPSALAAFLDDIPA